MMKRMTSSDNYCNADTGQPEQHGRVFKGIVVEYPEYSIYLEYKGKPYFSIKYTENRQEFIGYGTYNPEVLSDYLKEYFMPPAEPERKTGIWLIHKFGSDAQCSECKTFFSDVYDMENSDNYCRHCGAKMKGLRRTDE